MFCTGHETISTFECLKLRSDGTIIIDDYRNFNKDLWELEIQPNEEQKQIKESLNKISKNIAEISKMLQYMNTADIVCSLGANVSLININISKVKEKVTFP